MNNSYEGIMRTLSSYTIKFYFEGRGIFFFFFSLLYRKCRIQNGKSKIKSKAASLQVRGENVRVFIAILFHMATSNIFHSCFSFQMFLSGAAELLAPQNALLSDRRSTASSSFLKEAIYSVKFLSDHLHNFKTNSQCFPFTASLWEASGFLDWTDII